MCKHTDIAPHGCPIDGIPVPYNGTHKVDEATNRGPNHEHACAHIPRLQMPIQGDDREEEADGGEY